MLQTPGVGVAKKGAARYWQILVRYANREVPPTAVACNGRHRGFTN
ncbi:MAG: hypothetical protein V3V12_08410 [Gammaproteobacteria bacterium]